MGWAFRESGEGASQQDRRRELAFAIVDLLARDEIRRARAGRGHAPLSAAQAAAAASSSDELPDEPPVSPPENPLA